MIQGKVAAVTTRTVGAEVVAGSTGTLVAVTDASPFDEDGGEVAFDGSTYTYLAADPDADTLTLAEPLTVEAGDWLDVSPQRVTTEATVRGDEDDDALVARVPHALKARLVDGVREDDATAETVLLDWNGSGTLEVIDVVGRDGSQSWGDPAGRGADIGEDGYAIRDTLIVDSLASNGDVTIAGVPLLGSVLDEGAEVGWLDRFAAGAIARRRFGTPSRQRATGEEWGYAALSATCRAGRAYRISATVRARANVTGGTVVASLRVAEGASAELTSPVAARVDLGPVAASGATPRGYMETITAYLADTEIDVLVTYLGQGGATPELLEASLLVEDIGPQGTYGGGSYRPLKPASTADPTPDPQPTAPTVREFTTSWYASSSATYRGNGQRRTDSPDLVQGYNSYNGIGSAAIVFGGAAYGGDEKGKTLGEAITSAATLTKAEVWVYFNHWYAGSGGTARLSNLGGTSIPATQPASSITPTINKSGWRRDQGLWVSVPTAWFANPSTSRGIVLGGGGSRYSIYYGRANPHSAGTATRPRVRLTYTR